MSAPRIQVLVGMIASGKSTYALTQAKAGALIVGHDSLAEMLHGEYRYEQELRDCYRKMEESIAWAGLNAGRDVVIDRTHLTRESRRRWVKWARDYDSLQNFEGRGPTTRVEAVAFNVLKPFVHARRRFESDSRGRSYEDWLKVAQHHYAQAKAEPLLPHEEGFKLTTWRDSLLDPVVIEPPGFDIEASARQCREDADRFQAASREWAAAFAADPGICSCPACTQQYWAWGRRHRCVQCGFEYPTDWWPMYSYGVSASRPPVPRYHHEERMAHPYYRYGFEHPVEDAWAEHDKIDWMAVMPEGKGEPC